MSGVSPVIKLLDKTKARAFSAPFSHSSHAENALEHFPIALTH
jgi:hypothetical protein